MEHIGRLFLKTLEDLEARIRSGDDYEILGAAGLIRKLLMDDYPLVDQVNRRHRLKLVFELTAHISLPPGIPKSVFFSEQRGIDPDDVGQFRRRITATRDQLLGRVLLEIEDHSYTLKDIVLFEANVMGAVHAGSPKEEKEKVLRQVNDKFHICGLRSSLGQLQSIGRVVIKGLAPLRDAVEKANRA